MRNHSCVSLGLGNISIGVIPSVTREHDSVGHWPHSGEFQTSTHFFKKTLYVLFIFERESTSEGGAGREGDIESEAGAPGSEPSAQGPTQGLNP